MKMVYLLCPKGCCNLVAIAVDKLFCCAEAAVSPQVWAQSHHLLRLCDHHYWHLDSAQRCHCTDARRQAEFWRQINFCTCSYSRSQGYWRVAHEDGHSRLSKP